MRWRFFSAGESPIQGWKIHVSASALESPELLRTIVPILADARTAFKLPQRIDDVVYVNSGDAGLEQLGKVVTIYPEDDETARRLLIELDLVWPHSMGPTVLTDLHVRPKSAVSFRYGMFRPGPYVIDSTGRYSFAVTQVDGTRYADERTRDGKQPQGFVPPVEGFLPSAFPYKLHDEVAIGSESFILLSMLSEKPQSLVYLAADSASLETAVIKFARPGVGGDLLGRDCGHLLESEFRVLSVVAELGIAPKPLGLSSQLWTALAMADIRGERLSELTRVERISALPGLARAVAQVHAAGFVHGDIKLENALFVNRRVVLIDFELAAPVGHRTRRGGTRGHLPPEIDTSYCSAPSRDVYALAGCLFQALMDIPPGLLTSEPSNLANLLRNENADRAAQLFEWLAAEDPTARPTAEVAAVALEHFASNPEFSFNAPNDTPSLDWCRRASIDTAQACRSFENHNEDATCWRNAHFQRDFECEAINIGAAGILLGLTSIDTASRNKTFDQQIAGGARWLANASPDGKPAGLFTGNAGVAIALAVVAQRLGVEDFAEASRRRLEAAIADRREIDFFSGSAGVLYACCVLHEMLGEAWPLEHAKNLADELLQAVSYNDDVPVWRSSGKPGSDYLGCAHGSAGFALALAAYGRAADELVATRFARETFAALHRSGRTDTGALRMSLQSERHHAVGNWCHGVAGYLWAILQGLGDDPELADATDWAVACLSEAPTVGTATYCHGVAGQLELWCMLQRVPRYRMLANARANKAARALQILQQEVGGHGIWVSDDPDVITPDLWIGFLGPATALAMHAAGSRSALLSKEWLAACAVREATDCANNE